MKLIVVVALLGIFSFPAVVMADNAGPYLAADLGEAHFSNGLVNDRAPFIPAGPGIQKVTSEQRQLNDTAFRVTAGYQVTPNWGLELGYVDLGKARVVDATHTCEPVVTGCVQVDEDSVQAFKAKGWTLAATGTYAFSDTWALVGRLGEFYSQVQYDKSAAFTTSSGLGGSFSSDLPMNKWVTTYGIGLDWKLTTSWAARLGLDQYRNIGVSGISQGNVHVVTRHEGNVNLVSLGIVYSF
jgi:opacity protein-like surface antigen